MFTTLIVTPNLVLVTLVVGLVFGFSYTVGSWLASKGLR